MAISNELGVSHKACCERFFILCPYELQTTLYFYNTEIVVISDEIHLKSIIQSRVTTLELKNVIREQLLLIINGWFLYFQLAL
jgi:hypothetical protein